MLTLAELSTFNEDQENKLNEAALAQLGGIDALEKKLKTDFKKGLKEDEADLENRANLFGRNEFPEPESKSFIEMFLDSFQDTTLIVLIVSAVVSLAVGILEDPSKGWIEGAAILVAVLLVAIVTATNDYNKESQFRKLNAVKDDIDVGVIRNGSNITLSVKKLVVGDIVTLNAGDKVPADGVLIDGSDLSANESALTGESDDKNKSRNPVDQGGDMFMLSGSSISTGYCVMLVTAVGEQSRWGRTKAKLAAEAVDTPLQEKLDVLAGQIGNLGMAAAVATFIAMLTIWWYYPATREEGVTLFEYALKAFIMAVTIVVVAVPEGLPLAVTLSLAYSTQKMMKDNNLIRVLAACETMGNATNICSDKTGTLTQNRMTVVEGFFAGKYYKPTPVGSQLQQEFVQLMAEGISLNSTANLMKPQNAGEMPIVTGNKTEGALLLMLKSNFSIDYVPLRSQFNSARGDRLITFSSARKRMSVVLVNAANRGGICYTKGAAEIILGLCTHYIDQNGVTKVLDNDTHKTVTEVISNMAKNALRAVALAHRHIKSVTGKEDPEELESGLCLDCVFGIKDPLRPDVIEAVKACQEAGVFVRMVTGDNIETAKAIAKECGILTKGGIAMEGPHFRKLTPQQLDAVLPNLQVLARSSPDDKHTLVTRLNGRGLPTDKESWLLAHPDCNYEKQKDLLLPGYLEEWQAARAASGGVGEVVGVTGDGTNDGPALKIADVGLSMGLSGTDVAKEASDIVILDDNFSSIVKSVMWGRSVFDNIRKFLQFQLTVNVVALTITFVSALTGKDPPLNAVMMLWVNLIMDTMGALALGTEPPSPKLLRRRPYKRNASLISNKMLRNITVQFFFQFAVLSYLLLRGYADFGVEENSIQHVTVIFNAFVFCQVFNELNARSIGDDMNVFKGLHKNLLFIGIIIFTVVAQYGLIEYGGDFVRTTHLTPDQWIKCITLGALSLPLGGLMRLIPVADSLNDFAEVTSLVKANINERKSEHSNEKESIMSFSFLLWLAVAGIIPVIAYQQFGEVWTVEAIKLLGLLSSLFQQA